jgi:hypothetical protein
MTIFGWLAGWLAGVILSLKFYIEVKRILVD